MTQLYVPGELNLQQYRCENLQLHMNRLCEILPFYFLTYLSLTEERIFGVYESR